MSRTAQITAHFRNATSAAWSIWIEAHDYPCAWLSLDGTDSDVRVFLSYVVAAVQTVFPEGCTETLHLLLAAELPPLP